MKTVEREMKIRNKFGIHARPAALFVKTVSQFLSDIQVEKDGNIASGKSIMGLLTLEGYCDSTLKVTASGPDADEALNALQELVDNKFYED
ncbi:MAG TPA: HPr family phosphocarrier protein [Kiritimatiellia bacterium]|nr:HPr family phosphocarrier protein [Kiritimatiellia bacterium]HMO97626.1 HPr family phosphocarrier protein [Kiritimatiellia bacterium]HMP95986.1 HPr family phosphocarrier protein [Kiritimatiellia bacterium]